MKYTHITSSQNPQIKQIAKLRKAARARQAGVFIVEGARLIDRAIQCDYEIDQIISCQALYSTEEENLARYIEDDLSENTPWLDVTDFLYNSLSYRDSGSGLMAVMIRKQHDLKNLPRVTEGFYIVLESPEKPGNIGAVCRSADAAGAAGMIICDPHTDPYNPNALTASTGAIFSTPLAICTTDELIQWLSPPASDKDTNKKTRLLAATCTQQSISYLQANFCGTVAIAIGTEHDGLSPQLTDAADTLIHIPMKGHVDSLNASTAAAVLMFEAARNI